MKAIGVSAVQIVIAIKLRGTQFLVLNFDFSNLALELNFKSLDCVRSYKFKVKFIYEQ